MATVRVTGKVDGIPVGTNPVVVVELLAPTIGGHRTVQATTADAQGRFCFEDLDMIEATFNQAFEDLHVRVTAATRDGLRAQGVVCIPTSGQGLLSILEPDLIIRLGSAIDLAPSPESCPLLSRATVADADRALGRSGGWPPAPGDAVLRALRAMSQAVP